MYEVLFTHEAEKQYKKLGRDAKLRVNKAIASLSAEPLTGPHVKKLLGELKGRHRYALGGLRIIYRIEIDKLLVTVVAIRSRGDVYKK